MLIANKNNILKSLLLGTAMATALLSASAVAQEFRGSYFGLSAGYNTNDTDSAVIGGLLGFRNTVSRKSDIILGLEGEFDYHTAPKDFDLGIYGTAGIRVNDNGIIFGRLGYSRYDGDVDNFDGLTIGGGYEFGVNEDFTLRLGYDYTLYNDSTALDGHKFKSSLILNF